MELIILNLTSPPILFFGLGLLASILRSDLKLPEALYATLTIYLLCAIGFKGGVALSQVGLEKVWLPTLSAVALGMLIPLWSFFIIKAFSRLSSADAAAIAAHYGSVSAVTFIAATNYLKLVQVSYEPYASAFLAVMESPAIVISIVLARLSSGWRAGTLGNALKPALREALFGKSIFLLLGSLFIGWAAGERGGEMTHAFFVAPFIGILCLFLLEMGIVAGRRINALPKLGVFLILFGTLMPLFNGVVGVCLGKWSGLSLGGATLLGVLSASASYIAAPAAVRISIPEANPTYYLTASLGITFPFNLSVGTPLYFLFASWLYAA
ncbi:MAG: sodium-dependent bicarbonate transport family permease [Methylacidiphilales bacterium]|nr:sodium-dependent bicarbonate transport family permease [Candidatus Methylacidiphilales bacterium]MDW8349705.1 sodium-dependent bicarbonate transport family permease [Verrucomicrobiae bacterium]